MGQFIVPGEKLGIIEEFVAGKGTYVAEGVIRSSLAGISMVVDRTVSIHKIQRVCTVPRKGDIVVGQIVQSTEDVSVVKIFRIRRTYIPHGSTGLLHISMMKRGLVRSLVDVFKVGDIIRAEVVGEKNTTYHLSTLGRMFGVLQAFCSSCGQPLVLRGLVLYCSVCGRRERRKVAFDYGRLKI